MVSGVEELCISKLQTVDCRLEGNRKQVLDGSRGFRNSEVCPSGGATSGG